MSFSYNFDKQTLSPSHIRVLLNTYTDTNNVAIATDPDKDFGFAAQWTLPSWALNYRRVTFTTFKMHNRKSLLKPKTNHFGISVLFPEGGAPTEYHGSQPQVRL